MMSHKVVLRSGVLKWIDEAVVCCLFVLASRPPRHIHDGTPDSKSQGVERSGKQKFFSPVREKFCGPLTFGKQDG